MQDVVSDDRAPKCYPKVGLGEKIPLVAIYVQKSKLLAVIPTGGLPPF